MPEEPEKPVNLLWSLDEIITDGSAGRTKQTAEDALLITAKLNMDSGELGDQGKLGKGFAACLTVEKTGPERDALASHR